MKADLIRIGNSKGIRIPKAIIEQCGLGDSVELAVENGQVIISADLRPRRGWDEAFRLAVPVRPDPVLTGGFANRFDEEEWCW